MALAASLPHAGAQDRLPHVIVNFITSLDGHSTVGGGSTGLGDAGDKDIFRALRERADAILAGTTTMQSESYGRALPAAERRRRRLDAGRSAEPLVVTVTRSGKLPLEIPLFDEPEAEVVVFTPPTELGSVRAKIHVEPYDPSSATSMRAALAILRQRYDVRLLLCEGGPTLFSALLREGLVNELFLTLAPKLSGGDGPRITGGTEPTAPLDLRLLNLMERDGSLFTRYAVELPQP